MASRICIFAAIRMESAAIAHALHLPRHDAVELMWASDKVQVLTIGIRAVQLHALMPLVEEFAPTGVIVAGLAGALDPMLHVGDVVLDGRLNGPVPHAHLRRGRIHTSDTLIATAEAKAELFARTSALAVDMETEVVRRQLDKLVPLPAMLALRAISDGAGTALDPELPGLVDALGHVRMGAVARMLGRRPSAIGELMTLRSHARQALGALVPVIGELVRRPEMWIEGTECDGNALTN